LELSFEADEYDGSDVWISDEGDELNLVSRACFQSLLPAALRDFRSGKGGMLRHPILRERITEDR
jgi:hypothetical protein